MDRKTLAKLYSAHRSAIRRYIASNINSVQDAEDLAQTVFLELCRSARQNQEYRNIEAYLFAIARRLIAEYRRNKKRQLQMMRVRSTGVAPDGEEVEPYQKPAEQTLLQQMIEVLEHAGNKLTPQLRQAIELRLISGYSSKEAARKARCSVWAFYKRLDKAARTLEHMIKEEQ